MTTVDTVELNAKKELLRNLLRCPHRKLDETIPAFSSVLENDPQFAGQCFYALTLDEFNQIRDLEESAIAHLLTSEFPEHREAGRVTFLTLPPYRAARVAVFVRASLSQNRQVKGAVSDYLSILESNENRFKNAVKVSRRPIHSMYEMYHIKPSKLAQTLIFDKEVPEGDVDPVSLLVNAETPEEQAEIIITHKIPYRTATSNLKGITPAVWVALIEVMTPAEAVNARGSVEDSGILSDPQIRKLYEDKLGRVAKSSVSASTITSRKSAQGKDERVEKILSDSRQEKFESGAKITEDVLIAVDRSSSMHGAIEVAKRLGPFVSSICDSSIKVVAFNDTAGEVTPKGTKFEDYQDAFRMIRANGNTSLGAALDLAVRRGFSPELAIFITDQGENQNPALAGVFRDKARDTRFLFLNLPDTMGRIHHGVAQDLNYAGADVAEFDLDRVNLNSPGWYAVFDNLTPLLTKGGYRELVERIMALELPKRKGK